MKIKVMKTMMKWIFLILILQMNKIKKQKNLLKKKTNPFYQIQNNLKITIMIKKNQEIYSQWMIMTMMRMKMMIFKNSKNFKKIKIIAINYFQIKKIKNKSLKKVREIMKTQMKMIF